MINYTIGTSFSAEVSFQIYKNYKAIDQLCFNSTILSAKYQDFYSVSEKIAYHCPPIHKLRWRIEFG